MRANEHSLLVQLREILSRGPGPARRTSRLREALRSLLLRALRPYSYYQAEVNALLIQFLTEVQQTRVTHTQQISRLEDVVEELIATCESLRRASAERSEHMAERAELALEQAHEARRMVARLADQLDGAEGAAFSPEHRR